MTDDPTELWEAGVSGMRYKAQYIENAPCPRCGDDAWKNIAAQTDHGGGALSMLAVGICGSCSYVRARVPPHGDNEGYEFDDVVGQEGENNGTLRRDALILCAIFGAVLSAIAVGYVWIVLPIPLAIAATAVVGLCAWGLVSLVRLVAEGAEE